MSANPTVTIIILNYNGRAFIEESIDSALKSRYLKFDILIIDNGSTDGSADHLIKRYKSTKKVTVYSSKVNTFFAGGVNLGVRLAKGDLILFLNSDVVIEKNCVTELVKICNKNAKYIVQPKVLSYWNKNIIDSVGGLYTKWGFGFNIGSKEDDHGQYENNRQSDYAYGSIFMTRRSFFNEVGGFDPWFKGYYEDVDLSLRAKAQGGAIWYCYKALAYHKISMTYKKYVSIENLLFDIRKNRLKTVLKNFKSFERVVRLLLLLPTYIPLFIQDILTFKKERLFVTINALSANLK